MNHTLEDTLHLAHGRLDVQGLDVLPVLLEERHQEVDSNVDVGEKLLLGHLDVANSGVQAEGLLELELDGALDLVDLVVHGLLMGDETRELTGLVKARAQKTGDLLDERLGSQERVVLLSKLLDLLLVLVELLEVLHSLAGHTHGIGLLLVLGISEDAHLHVGPRDTGKLDGSTETLVLLGIVLLQTDLELHGLTELSPLGLIGPRLEDLDGLAQSFTRELTLFSPRELVHRQLANNYQHGKGTPHTEEQGKQNI
jgi:hypothetical protein